MEKSKSIRCFIFETGKDCTAKISTTYQTDEIIEGPGIKIAAQILA